MEINLIEGEELKYAAKIDGDKIKLRYSKSAIWNSNFRGVKIGSLKDTGNNIKIKINNKKIKLDYDEFVELLILMKLKEEFDDNL